MSHGKRTLASHLAHRVRAVRTQRGLRQSDVAARAAQIGLGWTPATVSNVEAGGRALTLGEFLLLPGIFGGSLAELVCDGEAVEVAPGLIVDCETLRLLLRGGQLSPGLIRQPRESESEDEADPRRIVLEAERKAARKFGVSTDVLLDAAIRLWGRNLSTERDVRTLAALTPDEQQNARAVQARRGHITRDLLAQLERELMDHERGDGGQENEAEETDAR